ncbi:MAG: UDP-N-acetylglucosamine--undecaprenyl-phosphate N-acetylglucosaminephosphotransferase, partial [Aeromonas sp.]
IRKGHSPFKPDREHLHHICLRAGLSPLQALSFICTLAMLFAAAGIALECNHVPELLSFGLFMLAFVLYFVGLNSVWRMLAWVRRMLGRTSSV